MKVSVIVTTYKNIPFLKFVLDALKLQDYKDFEVVIAEDDNDEATALFLKNYQGLEILHVSHPNIGRTKTKIQNEAIIKSRGEYLIFLDGDVLVYSKFISSQVTVARRRQIIAGRRVNLNEKITEKIKNGSLFASMLEKYYFFYALLFMFDKEVRFEQGIFIDPSSYLYKYFLSKRKRNISILGCNWSCFKDDFVAINGFDEGYINSSIGEDTDLDWRFQRAGYEVISGKNIANVFHLYHKKSDILGGVYGKRQQEERKNKNLYICEQGLAQHGE